MMLYFGARYEATEYLYGDEIDQYLQDGIHMYMYICMYIHMDIDTCVYVYGYV